MHIPILSIVGKSGSGKTTLIERIVPELKQRGYRVATIKHHSHPGFEIDQPGKDTWRFARAGSDCVVLAAPDKFAIVQKTSYALDLDEIVSHISGVDIILTEGFKRAGKSAIEIVREETGLELLCSPPQLLAIVSDSAMDNLLPHFGLNEITQIVDFIEPILF